MQVKALILKGEKIQENFPNRFPNRIKGPVAQRIEHRFPKPGVGGSTPPGVTNFSTIKTIGYRLQTVFSRRSKISIIVTPFFYFEMEQRSGLSDAVIWQ